MAKGDAGDMVGLLAHAAEVVEQANLPEDLRSVAFGRVLDLTLATGAPEPPAKTPKSPAAPTKGQDHKPPVQAARAGSEDPIAALAAELKLDRDLIERVFDFDGESVQLTVATSDLLRSKNDATGQVTYLVTAALQASGRMESVPIQVVKNACEAQGVLDAPNFSRAWAKIKGKGISERGKGKDRSYKVNRRGYEIAAEIVKTITSPTP